MSQQLSYQIDNLYLSITDHCTLACAFCPKTQGLMHVKGYDLSFAHRPTAQEIINSTDDPRIYQEVLFYGFGETTLRLSVLLESAQAVKARGGRDRVTLMAIRPGQQETHSSRSRQVGRRSLGLIECTESTDL